MTGTFSAVPHELLKDEALRPFDHSVAAELLMHARGHRTVTVTNRTLATELRVCTKTIGRSLERLQLADWIRRRADPDSTTARIIDLGPICDRKKAPHQNVFAFAELPKCPPVPPLDSGINVPCPTPGQGDKNSTPEPVPYRNAREERSIELKREESSSSTPPPRDDDDIEHPSPRADPECWAAAVERLKSLRKAPDNLRAWLWATARDYEKNGIPRKPAPPPPPPPPRQYHRADPEYVARYMAECFKPPLENRR